MKFLLLSVLLLCHLQFFGQGLNNNWITGYGGGFGDPDFGESIIDFSGGIPNVILNNMEMDFNQSHANISDTNGNLLFYTNGFYIADATGDTMLNGTGINPSVFTSMFQDGLTLVQSHVILPKPNNTDIYYLFHTTRDDGINSVSKYLYVSTIDMNMNGGLGEVTTKNQILLSKSLTKAKLTAVKHGNGRDWWLLTHELNTNKFYKFFITPSGISPPDSQSIGIMNYTVNGQVYFTPNGDKYVNSWRDNGFELYDFDRCTGVFSNANYILPSPKNGIGISFSPDGSKLYASSTDSLYQFDLNATNIQASQTLVAAYDSFLSAGAFPLPTFFEHMALAPDGKIYMTTGNGTQHYHIIDQPDSLGTACNVIQHGLNLNHYYYNTLPNHPNYHLGPLVGSICDTCTPAYPHRKNGLR